ncbi:hypothetical protein [Plantibacter sp. RU18]
MSESARFFRGALWAIGFSLVLWAALIGCIVGTVAFLSAPR